MAAINDRFDDDQLATILEWLQAANDAVDRSTAASAGCRPSVCVPSAPDPRALER